MGMSIKWNTFEGGTEPNRSLLRANVFSIAASEASAVLIYCHSKLFS